MKRKRWWHVVVRWNTTSDIEEKWSTICYDSESMAIFSALNNALFEHDFAEGDTLTVESVNETTKPRPARRRQVLAPK
jgi:hypothetical protein